MKVLKWLWSRTTKVVQWILVVLAATWLVIYIINQKKSSPPPPTQTAAASHSGAVVDTATLPSTKPAMSAPQTLQVNTPATTQHAVIPPFCPAKKVGFQRGKLVALKPQLTELEYVDLLIVNRNKVDSTLPLREGVVASSIQKNGKVTTFSWKGKHEMTTCKVLQSVKYSSESAEQKGSVVTFDENGYAKTPALHIPENWCFPDEENGMMYFRFGDDGKGIAVTTQDATFTSHPIFSFPH